MRVIVGIQARLASKRLPRKVLEDIGGKTMLQRVYEACDGGDRWERWVLIPNNASEDELWKYVHHKGWRYIRGPMDDVYERYMLLMKQEKPAFMIRVCADAPFIKKEWIADAIGLNPVFIPNVLHGGPASSWRKVGSRKREPDEHAGYHWFQQNGLVTHRAPSDYLMVNTPEDLKEARRRVGEKA